MKTWPPRRTNRVMTRRAASLWRFVIQKASAAWRPYSPNARSLPWVATPVRRPRCCLRNLTRAGSNISLFLLLGGTSPGRLWSSLGAGCALWTLGGGGPAPGCPLGGGLLGAIRRGRSLGRAWRALGRSEERRVGSAGRWGG